MSPKQFVAQNKKVSFSGRFPMVADLVLVTSSLVRSLIYRFVNLGCIQIGIFCFLSCRFWCIPEKKFIFLSRISRRYRHELSMLSSRLG